jgi:hypothetical protein
MQSKSFNSQEKTPKRMYMTTRSTKHCWNTTSTKMMQRASIHLELWISIIIRRLRIQAAVTLIRLYAATRPERWQRRREDQQRWIIVLADIEPRQSEKVKRLGRVRTQRRPKESSSAIRVTMKMIGRMIPMPKLGWWINSGCRS